VAASRRIGHKRLGPSFETPRKRAAPQDEVECVARKDVHTVGLHPAIRPTPPRTFLPSSRAASASISHSSHSAIEHLSSCAIRTAAALTDGLTRTRIAAMVCFF
jgi:hypothetical protein